MTPLKRLTRQAIYRNSYKNICSRRDAALSAGGIGEMDRLCGAEVPSDWVLDQLSYFWIPPNVRLFP